MWQNHLVSSLILRVAVGAFQNAEIQELGECVGVKVVNQGLGTYKYFEMGVQGVAKDSEIEGRVQCKIYSKLSGIWYSTRNCSYSVCKALEKSLKMTSALKSPWIRLIEKCLHYFMMIGAECLDNCVCNSSNGAHTIYVMEILSVVKIHVCTCPPGPWTLVGSLAIFE